MNATGFAFLDWPGPIAFAHQGGADEFPENTMKAFEACIGLGYRYIETDVHATSDGVVVVMHDATLDRTTDRSGAIANLPWTVVKQTKVHGREPVPRLDEVLDAFPDVRFNIEPKSDDSVDPFIDVIRRTGTIDRVCAGSFSDRRLRRMRKVLGESLCTSMGTFDTARLRLGSWAPLGPLSRLMAGTGAACAQLPVKKGPVAVIDRRSVGLAHRLGLAVHAWTIDEPDEIARLLDVGVDGVMTDQPSILKNVLVGRGQWVTP
jgi:glycerophosphoryl diester phosphodiesterase